MRTRNSASVTYEGHSTEKVTAGLIDSIRSNPRTGYFGKSLEEGCYALYLGPSDGGFLILEPTDPKLSGVPEEEKAAWVATHGDPEQEVEL